MYIFYQPNPADRAVGDCSVRAIAAVFGISWDEAFLILVNEAFHQADMPSSNAVWSSVLRSNGFKKYNLIENENYNINDFANQHTYGVYVVSTGEHIVPVIDGDYLDAWDSGREIPESYWICENREALGV